jgi:hypothetical protein
LSQED